jgi:hypothetical protein
LACAITYSLSFIFLNPAARQEARRHTLLLSLLTCPPQIGQDFAETPISTSEAPIFIDPTPYP